MNRFILSQLFGGLSAFAMILSSWQIKKKKIYFFLTLDNIFCFIQYILLQAYTGAFSNIIGLIRLLLFNFKGRNKFFKTKWPLIIVLLLYSIIGFITYQGVSSLFPTVASILYAVALYQDKEKIIRISTSIMLFCWLIYNLFVHAYIGAITEGVMFLSSILAIIKIDVLKRLPHQRETIVDKLKRKYYQGKVKELIKVNFVDDYDILMEIFESEDNVLSVMSRLEEYDRDKQILIKILLNINKSIKIDNKT
ncbi:MAG: YgjV family protein [Bacilli bacterium]|nr:YgjV family protein [Bacilli bacterium]